MRQNASYHSIISYHYKKVIAASAQKKRIMQNLKRVLIMEKWKTQYFQNRMKLHKMNYIEYTNNPKTV